MRTIERNIDDVRAIRGDLSTWLVHLTKGNIFKDDAGARAFYGPKQCLENILNTNTLNAVSAVGQFNYSSWYRHAQANDLKAVSFTETPLSEIFLFINIKNKALKFSSYGLVFNREDLAKSPVFAAPVLYFSQPEGNNHYLNKFNQLEQSHYSAYKEILFLFDKFGKTYSGKDYNFMWEREWRVKGNLASVKDHVKFGLCPESDISYFESKFPGMTFVDPFINPRQIEAKLKVKGIIP